MKNVFITGGTGYIGARLIQILRNRGHQVQALVRTGSEAKLAPGVPFVVGDPLVAESFVQHIPKGCTFVQLLGVPHPSPKKKDLFYQIDLPSAKASAEAALSAEVGHFVYISVAQEPSGIMRDYQKVRAISEDYISKLGLPHTFIRPWYVLGPGHWWPILLLPVYAVLKLHPVSRRKVKAFGLVRLSQILEALVKIIENPATMPEILEIDEIKKLKGISWK